MAKRPEIGTLVSVKQDRRQPPITVRVEDLLSIQFTYTKLDDDTVIGLCHYDGDWRHDFTTEEPRKERAPEGSPRQIAERDCSGSEVVDGSWLHARGRRRKAGAS